MSVATPGGRQGGDRRSGDRRRVDRRAPAPWWRRPSAFVAYGVAGALAVVLLVQAFTPEVEEPAALVSATDGAAAAAASDLPSLPPGSAREAYSVADFETLIAEGDRAVGQLVRADLFCGTISSRQVRDVVGMHPTLTSLADADGRVGGAECQWGREGRSAEILLVVPPALAAEFASAPEEEINFVRRRRVGAQLEWLGRSEALSLRYAGVLRVIVQ